MPDMSSQAGWRLRAACRGAGPELFFPEGVAGPALQAAAQAKRICSVCPVRARCLDWAVVHGAAIGIWGGRTEGERHAHRIASALRHRKRRPPRRMTGQGRLAAELCGISR
jgi:WhiB family redox-sensing transcriptional regulator